MSIINVSGHWLFSKQNHVAESSPEKNGFSSCFDLVLVTQGTLRLQNTVLAQECSDVARFGATFSTTILKPQPSIDITLEIPEAKATQTHATRDNPLASEMKSFKPAYSKPALSAFPISSCGNRNKGSCSHSPSPNLHLLPPDQTWHFPVWPPWLACFLFLGTCLYNKRFSSKWSFCACVSCPTLWRQILDALKTQRPPHRFCWCGWPSHSPFLTSYYCYVLTSAGLASHLGRVQSQGLGPL